MARVAFIHNALGKTDGVSLEVDKWRACCESLGHDVLYIAGNELPGIITVPELSFFHPETRKLLENATVKLVDFDEPGLVAAIEAQAERLKEDILRVIEREKIDILIPNNLLSVGYHVAAAVALNQVIEQTGIRVIAHNHDFYFEDSDEVEPTCDSVWRLLDSSCPCTLPSVQNVVINKIAQAEVQKRKRITPRVVPNVWNFNQSPWNPDEYNKDFRSNFDIKENDIVVLQATRVMDRKGIELAVDLVGYLSSPESRQRLIGKTLHTGKVFSEDSNIILLCVGHIEEFGARGDYVSSLKRRATEQGVDLRFIGERIKHSRSLQDDKKIYALWDTYCHADIVSYPSQWEGWGNQLIEAFFAKLPVVMFEYPVFVSDLKHIGFSCPSLGDTITGRDEDGLVLIDPERLRHAGDEAITLLLDKERRKALIDRNYQLAKENFSFEVLTKIITELFKNAGIKE